MASKIVDQAGNPQEEGTPGHGTADFKQTMILNFRNQKMILQERMLMIDHLISLVESSQHVVEFAGIMQAMQTQGK